MLADMNLGSKQFEPEKRVEFIYLGVVVVVGGFIYTTEYAP